MSDQSAEEAAIDRFVTKLKSENAALRATAELQNQESNRLSGETIELRAENERLRQANEHWHQRMAFVKTDTEALTAQVTALEQQLAASEARVKELEKVFEYRRAT